jgi:hypothetical protein
VGNNPLKYIDPTGHVKVTPVDMGLADYEIDILSPTFLLDFSFVLASNNGSAAIRVVVLITKGLGFVIQL